METPSAAWMLLPLLSITVLAKHPGTDPNTTRYWIENFDASSRTVCNSGYNAATLCSRGHRVMHICTGTRGGACFCAQREQRWFGVSGG